MLVHVFHKPQPVVAAEIMGAGAQMVANGTVMERVSRFGQTVGGDQTGLAKHLIDRGYSAAAEEFGVGISPLVLLGTCNIEMSG